MKRYVLPVGGNKCYIRIPRSKLDAYRSANTLVQRLAKHGFTPLTSSNIDEPLRAHGYLRKGSKSNIICEDEIILNRGAGVASNFFVFIKLRRNNITVFYTNPEANTTKIYDPSELYIEYTISVGKDGKARIGEIADNIVAISKKKPKHEYRFQMHFHMKEVLPGYDIYDDGGSTGVSILRRLMLYHMDGFIPTPHNSVELEMYNIFKIASKRLHMTFVPALELTIPIYEQNGPHHIVAFRSAIDAVLFAKKILSKRKDSEMPPYFEPKDDNYYIHEIYEDLNVLKRDGRLVTFIAHPMIQEDKKLPLYITGLVSASLAGIKLRIFDTNEIKAFTLEEAKRYAERNEGVSIYNQATSPTQKFVKIDHKLKQIIANEMRIFRLRYGNVNIISPRIATYLIGRWLARMYRMNTIYESDEHETMPFGTGGEKKYVAGGDGFGIGFTRVFIGKELRKKLKEEKRILTPADFVDGILKKQIRTKAVVFARVEDGYFKSAKERREAIRKHSRISKWRVKLRRWYTYVRGVLASTIESAIETKVDVLRMWNKLTK